MTSRSFCRFAPALLVALTLALALPALADDRGEGPLDPSQPTGITVDQIIQKFAAKEKQFKQAREQYTYTQDVTVQTLDGNTVDGEYHQVSDILFDNEGHRIEQVTFAPQSSLQRVVMTQSDYDDIRHRLPFVLTSDDIGKYQIMYVGKQREDELGTYVFDIAPKTMEKGERYFQGRIWVDDHDYQIVKTYGETVPQVHNPKHPEKENLSPKYTTWRQQIDNVYWFPTYTYAEDTLHFAGGDDVRMRYIVKYKNYKRYGAKSRITYEGQELSKTGDSGSQNSGGTEQPAQPAPKQ
jgi:outer membrane lipoprotein-sorting protein